MHKITKGIKKKIKSKKGHKGDDLFDPAELEKYRKEKEQREAAAAEEAGGGADEGGDDDATPKEEDEEWQRFKLLTAGVDSVLKKTQGDLDRIKSTSYFQRKKPGTSEARDRKGPTEGPATAAPKESPASQQPAAGGARPKRWVGFEEGAPIDEPPPEEESKEAEEEGEKGTEGEEEESALGGEAEEVEEEEEEEEEDPGEDIFDTSYVDVVASGEVKLAYIPESPPEEDQEEDDPFDTSIAEKVIGPEPPKGKKARQLVSLGSAVEVLTGRIDRTQVIPVTHPAQSSKKRRVAPPRRPEDVDLFVLDDEDQQGTTEGTATGDPPRSRRASGVATDPFGVLDDDELPDTTPIGEALTTIPPVTLSVHKEEDGEGGLGDSGPGEETVLKDLVAEFDIIGEAETSKTEEELIFGKKPDAKEQEEGEDLEEDEFAALAAESFKRSPAPPTTLNLEGNEDFVDEDDPFDTSVAAGVLGELPATPQKVPPCRPPRPVSSPDVDVLLGGGKDEDLGWEEFEKGRGTVKGPPPLRPAPPSAGPPPRPSQPPSRPPPITGVTNSDGGFVPSLGQPPLTFTETAIEEISRDLDSRLEAVDADDPFDTSFAEVAAAPGRTELRLIESEILGDVEEEFFDPRAGECSQNTDDVQSSVTIHISLPKEEQGAEEVFGKGQTPQRVSADLFDSTEVHTGEEFVSSLQLSHRDLLGGSTTDLSKLGHDPISPDEPIEQTLEEELEDYIDPFDTSIVDPRIAPGKAELKILEKELLGEVDTPPVAKSGVLQRTISDPDFDPRSGVEVEQQEVINRQPSLDSSRPDLLEAENRVQEVPEVSELILSPSARPDLLSVGEVDAEFSKPLTPLVEEGEKISEAVLRTDGVDPFDTTFAENILPGKAELRIIESELFGQPDVTAGTGITRSLSDPDFDPRGATGHNQTSQEQTGVVGAASVVHHRRFSDVSALGGGGGNRKTRIIPPATLPLQNVAHSIIVSTVAPEETRQNQPDLLAVEEESEAVAKPLSPARQLEDDIEDDPFDTSAVSSSVLQPGKAELKILESELIGGQAEELKPALPSNSHANITAQILVTQLQATSQAPAPIGLTSSSSSEIKPPDLLNLPEADEAPAGPKPLTPLVESSDFPGVEDFDPFDTSIAEGICPGRTELKLLESELIGQ